MGTEGARRSKGLRSNSGRGWLCASPAIANGLGSEVAKFSTNYGWVMGY